MSAPCRQDAGVPHPGSIRAAIPHPAGGTIIMSGFPGLETGIDGTAAFVPASCAETLQGMVAMGAMTLTVLVERDELEAEFFDLLKDGADAAGIALTFFPIVDFSIPGPDQAQLWRDSASDRARAFASGETIAFACQYGAGRSGLMAAMCLIEGGMGAEAAITCVRSHFPEAIESDEQERWLVERG